MRIGRTKPGGEHRAITPDNRGGNLVIAGREVIGVGTDIIVAINIIPVLPVGCRGRGVEVHAFFHQRIIVRGQTVQNNGPVGGGRLRGGFIIVAAGKVNSTVGPGKTIGRVKVARRREHIVIVICRIVADQQLDHGSVLVLAAPGDIDPTDFRCGTHKVTIVEMVVGQALMRAK